MNTDIARLVKTVYTPPYKSNSTTVESWYAPSDVHLYSLARFALLNALKIMNWQAGDKILVPEYICRDLLAPLNLMNSEILFYPTNESLEPVNPPETWPNAKAVIAVNYFGLPQNLAPFESYKNRTGAIIIEDNAHGFLSRDVHGQLLGTRGDLGLLSIRKSLPIPNGAALLVNKNFKTSIKLREFKETSESSLNYKLKNSLRQVVPLIGAKNIQRMTTSIRKWRKLRYGYEINLGDYSDELSIPGSEAPAAVNEFLQKLDLDQLSRNRVELYKWLQQYLAPTGTRAVIRALPKNAVPYVFPFYCEPSKLESVSLALKKIGLESFPWPSLPQKVASSAPSYYTNLHCVRFQW